MHKLLDHLRAAVYHGEEGQMAIAMVILLLVVVVLFGLAFDTGKWYLDHRLAQQQAEAAALAGALQLPSGTVTTAVNQALADNGSSSSESTCPNDYTTEYVRVCVRRHSGGVFSALSGIDFAWVSASAKAERIAQPVPYSLMAMDPSACASFYLNGNALINVQGIGASAGTYTRSDCSTAITISGGNGVLKAQGNNDEVGGATSNCTSGVQCTPVPTTQEYLEDPFASVPLPPLTFGSCASVKVNNGQTQTLNPGCYSSLQILGTAYLNPGVYVLTGGLTMSGNSAVLSADANKNGVLDSNEQVMFYVTCPSGSGLPTPCNGTNATQFSSSGQSVFKLQGIAGKPRYENISIFVDRTAGPALAVDISGQGSSTMSGAIYAINSGARITGNGGTLNLNIAVVTNTLEFKGNGTVNITYNVDLIPPEYKLALTE